MKILIISRNTFPLQGPRAFRTAELSEQLAKMGHEVILYTVLGKYDYTQYQKDTKVTIKDIKPKLSTANNDGVTRYTFIDKVLYHSLHWLIEYPDIEFVFKLNSIIRKEKAVDLLITIAHPHPIHWGAAVAKKLNPKKFPKCWISDCGDPFYLNPFKKHPFYLKYIEKWWGNSTDYITVPTEDSKKGYFPEYHNKIRVIPQAFDFEKTPIAEYEKNSVPTFIFAGAFYKGVRDPYSFIDYLLTLDRDFKFTIYSRSKIQQEILDKSNGRIECVVNANRKDIIWACSKADFLINISNLSSVQTPSKLIDYGIAKRPVLNISNEFKEVDYLNEFLEADYSHQTVLPDLGIYDIKRVAQQFVDLINERV